MKNASLTYKSSSLSSGDPCYDIGEGVPPIGIKVEDPICGISRAIQVSFQYLEVSIKNARFKPQPSTLMLAFASMRSTPFMEIDDKGERLYKDMKTLGEVETKKERLDMDNGQRGINIKEKRWIKILEQEKHK
jgi:hypothetical protein